MSQYESLDRVLKYAYTTPKTDLYNNQDGYGYITHTWYITENGESPLYRDVNNLAKASTVNLYYTIDKLESHTR